MADISLWGGAPAFVCNIGGLRLIQEFQTGFVGAVEVNQDDNPPIQRFSFAREGAQPRQERKRTAHGASRG